jgi:WD40 repeat protein
MHPSGLYLAVEIANRIDILHWDSAEKVLPRSLVASKGEKYQAASWSPDGALLALDQNISQVFDVRTNTIRSCETLERWALQANNLGGKLTSCDGLRRFTKPPRIHSEWLGQQLNKQLAGVTDFAWHPRNPNLFATIGGENCPRTVRVWRLVK